MSNNNSSNDKNSNSNNLNIHWFRTNDIRLHDNPALCRTVALSSGKSNEGILPVFIFDTHRNYGSDTRSDLGCQKCGPRRAQFALEAVADLRNNLEKRCSGLVVAVGKPEIVLADIAKSYIASGKHTINVVFLPEAM